MGWKRIPGLKGKIFIPDAKPEQPKKHPCPDCYDCQMCSDDRCNVCRRTRIDNDEFCRNCDRIKKTE